MSTVSYEKRQKIIAQALNEIQFARDYKQNKTKNWKINEDLYYGRKINQDMARANVDLGQMSSFVHTILAKIDNPLVFKFTKRKEAQADRVTRLNALREVDSQRDNWDIKDIAGKKQGVIYGRAIYSYYAESEEGYKPHLDNVDVYDFLIDPSTGGIDIERARYIGDYGVVLTRQDLEAGLKAKIYSKKETEDLLAGSGNSTEQPQEEVNKMNRTYDTNISTPQKEISDKDKFKFWRWGTTYQGERYYLLLCETGATAIEVCPLEEKFAKKVWWYWTWAPFIDLTEFWSTSYCDYVREIFMAQAISVNQMLDNAEQINKPQTVVNVGAIEDMAKFAKYRRDGIIPVKASFDVTKALQKIQTPSINTPIEVFQMLDGIQEKASGVTAAAQGVAENNSSSKVSIYKGNQENVADRFGLLNKSYSFGYKRFAKLWVNGVNEHLLKKTAVDILGPDGVSTVMVSRRDIFRKDEEFGLLVEASNAEFMLSQEEKMSKLEFLKTAPLSFSAQGRPVQNNQKAYEISAGIAGFDAETIRQLQDTSDFGTASIMSKAEKDIESILDGEKVEPNQSATTAYKQRIVDYLTNNKDTITDEQFDTLFAYAASLDEIIARNMVRYANDTLLKETLMTPVDPMNPQKPVTPLMGP